MPSLAVILLVHNDATNIPMFLRAFEAHEPDDYELLVVDDACTDNSIELLGAIKKDFRVISQPNRSGVASIPKIANELNSDMVALLTPNVLVRNGWDKPLRDLLATNPFLEAVRPSTIMQNLWVLTDCDALMLAKTASLNGLVGKEITHDPHKTFEFTELARVGNWKTEADFESRVDCTDELDRLLTQTTVLPENAMIAQRVGSLPTDVEDFIRHNPSEFARGLVMAGRCNICAQPAAFRVLNRTVSLREQLRCSNCHSTSRYRSLARGILKAIKVTTGIEADALDALPDHCDRRLAIYDTQLAFSYPDIGYPIPDILTSRNWIDVYSSVYLPNQPFGTEYGDKKSNQNLEKLTYGDAVFDIVLTSEVMEHVRNYVPAHQEVARVLKPGGVYLFTVPHRMDVQDTLTQVVVHDPDDPSKDEIIGEPEYHGTATPDEPPPLSYRVYGRDIISFIDSLGFTVEYSGIDNDFPVNAIFETELFYCTKK